MKSILFLNAGRRVELIRRFRSAISEMGVEVKLVAANDHPWAAGLYECDTHHILPRSRTPEFQRELLKVCERENAVLIVPLIDPDLPVLARARKALSDEIKGLRILVSDAQAVDICRDKRKTFSFLKEHDFPTPEIFDLHSARRRSFPLFIKPADGSASSHTFKVNTLEELEFFWRYVPNPMIQEFVEGPEITTDVFSDWEGRPLTAVARRRLFTRAGEVSVGRVERHPELEELCIHAAGKLGTVGPINIQAIHSKGKYYLTEINPRFGGGCPLSMAAGAPLAKWAVQMALGSPLTPVPQAIKEGLTMIRFDDSFFRAIEPASRSELVKF